jgi:hypothetical protein
VVLTGRGDDFTPKRTFGSLETSLLATTQDRDRKCYWRLGGKGQGYCYKPYNAQERPSQQPMIWTPMSIALRLRNTELELHIARRINPTNTVEGKRLSGGYQSLKT